MGLKMLEKVMDKRLGKVVTIEDAQFGFQPEKGTIDAMFILRQVQKKSWRRERSCFFAFLDLEKAYDRVPREVVFWCMRSRGIQEKLIRMFKQHLRR